MPETQICATCAYLTRRCESLESTLRQLYDQAAARQAAEKAAAEPNPQFDTDSPPEHQGDDQ